MDKRIPSDILPYFNEIAERLKAGHATVMVGAGFSRNAKERHSFCKGFPDWNQLGDVFYEKLYGSNETEEEKNSNKKYMNVLKIAHEVDISFGRTTLDKILKTEIPDKDYLPSELHTDLMRLPWSDVLTTNYDTLLERAAENIYEQRYDIVVNKDDLIYSSKPRIIKLHGSFPSERPFIITEEDYRQYPKTFAPFVNTVQQSLLESTLCLIGFSGDDPNFLSWIGWIRDNLGKENSPKIYFIGMGVNETQKRLLAQRNIIAIDLFNCEGMKGKYTESLELFISFLHTKNREDDKLDWPSEPEYCRFHPQKINEIAQTVIDHWKKEREEYPCWLIVPNENREKLKSYIFEYNDFIENINSINPPLDTQFLFEYNWRLEKCLIPIFPKLLNALEGTTTKYSPFPTKNTNNSTITPNSSIGINLNWGQIKHYWIELKLAIARHYREAGFNTKWIELTDELLKNINQFSQEQKSKYYYERVLFSLYSFDIEKVREEIDNWPTNLTLPYWEAKKASILCEIGELNLSNKIIDEALKRIKQNQNLSPTVSNYKHVSEEAYLMSLYFYVKREIARLNDEWDFEKLYNHATQRWNILGKYKCFPKIEFNLIENLLTGLDTEYEHTKSTMYDIGSYLYTYSTQTKKQINSQSLFRLYEETGVPITMSEKKAIEAAISFVSNDTWHWSVVNLIRYGDNELIHSLFNEKSIYNLTPKATDQLASIYIKALIKIKDNENINTENNRTNSIIKSIVSVLPEVLSRLCSKCSYKIRVEILEMLLSIYNLPKHNDFKAIGNLTKKLINSFSIKEKYNLLPLFLNFPIHIELHVSYMDKFVEPFKYINNIRQEDISTLKPVGIDEKVINSLIESTKSNTKEIRRNSLLRLATLYNLGILNKKLITAFTNILWEQIDECGFPKNFSYSYFAYLTLPTPDKINIDELLKYYFKNHKFPLNIKDDKTTNFRVKPYGNVLRNFTNNLKGCNNKEIAFEFDEETIEAIIQKTVTWWDTSKEGIKDVCPLHPWGINEIKFQDQFIALIEIYSACFGCNSHLINSENIKELKRVISEFKQKNLPSNEAIASCINIFPELEEELFESINENLFSKSDALLEDTVKAIQRLNERKKDSTKFIHLISEFIRNRTDYRLVLFINNINIIIKESPEVIDAVVLKNLQIGLEYLISEIRIFASDNSNTVNDKLYIKRSAAKLAVSLYKYFSQKDKHIPLYISKWKEICNDKNEFAEIRNIWDNVEIN